MSAVVFSVSKHIMQWARVAWASSYVVWWRTRAEHWLNLPFSGTITLLGGIIIITALIWGFDQLVVMLVNPGVIYLPLAALFIFAIGSARLNGYHLVQDRWIRLATVIMLLLCFALVGSILI